MNMNTRTVLALRALADQLEQTTLPVGTPINHALSTIDGDDDAARMLVLILAGAAKCES